MKHIQFRKKAASAFLSLIIALSGCGAFAYWYWYTPYHPITHYYEILNSQEQVTDGVAVTEQEWNTLKQCKRFTGPLSRKRILDCITDFYEQYTLTHGVRKSFSHLAALEKKSTDFVEDCHYVSHGIGHAQLKVDKGDAGKSFSELSENLYFKNVSTCGNGYFHGVIEEVASTISTKDGLVDILKPICGSLKYDLSDCYHGIGHAAYIQLNYMTHDALYVCDAVTDDQFMRFSCQMGIFMEMAQDFQKAELVDVVGDTLKFKVCDALDVRFQEACYSQHSGFFVDIAPDPSNYAQLITYCKQIVDPRNRMACVKFYAGKAVRSVQYTNVRAMCIDGTSTKDERIMCTAAYATRIARSIDAQKGRQFNRVVNDICRYLPWYEVGLCQDLGLNQRDKIYFDPVSTGVM
jgi:hypothetical protein